jgi:DNA-binding PadR family transcriptional regulator
MPPPLKSEDKRSRKDLELFVLALISRGIVTTYDLKMSAAISPGASIPVLSRLESSGLIKKGREGARNRQEYQITGKGTHLLQESWSGIFRGLPEGDMEVVLRIACIALIMGEPKRSVADYLARAAQVRKEAERAAENAASIPGSAIEAFPWMRDIALLYRRRNEAVILRQLASKLRRTKIK